jgi:protoheme IX farnesyltransferase
LSNITKTEILVTKDSIAAKLNLIAEISKVKITVFVSLSTALGYILAAEKISVNLFFCVFGIFLIACSATALNQYQESEFDKLMNRTRNRPIPSGRVSANFVFNMAMVFLISGSGILYFFVNFYSLIIALITLIWYNAVYTPLKRKSALAIIPGSLVGALPPIAGWVGAGGSLSAFYIYLIAFYFFVWQIPHFWLLLSLYGNEYKSAGFPILNDLLPQNIFKGITFILILITILMTIAIGISGIVNYFISFLLIVFASMFLFYSAIEFMKSGSERKNIVRMFVKINLHTLLIIIFLSADKLISLNKIF